MSELLKNHLPFAISGGANGTSIPDTSGRFASRICADGSNPDDYHRARQREIGDQGIDWTSWEERNRQQNGQNMAKSLNELVNAAPQYGYDQAAVQREQEKRGQMFELEKLISNLRGYGVPDANLSGIRAAIGQKIEAGTLSGTEFEQLETQLISAAIAGQNQCKAK